MNFDVKISCYYFDVEMGCYYFDVKMCCYHFDVKIGCYYFDVKMGCCYNFDVGMDCYYFNVKMGCYFSIIFKMKFIILQMINILTFFNWIYFVKNLITSLISSSFCGKTVQKKVCKNEKIKEKKRKKNTTLFKVNLQ